MNPVFWLLVLLGAVILWFLLTFIFIPLGDVILKKWDKTVEVLNREEKEEKEEVEKWEEKRVN